MTMLELFHILMLFWMGIAIGFLDVTGRWHVVAFVKLLLVISFAWAAVVVALDVLATKGS